MHAPIRLKMFRIVDIQVAGSGGRHDLPDKSELVATAFCQISMSVVANALCLMTHVLSYKPQLINASDPNMIEVIGYLKRFLFVFF